MLTHKTCRDTVYLTPHGRELITADFLRVRPAHESQSHYCPTPVSALVFVLHVHRARSPDPAPISAAKYSRSRYYSSGVLKLDARCLTVARERARACWCLSRELTCISSPFLPLLWCQRDWRIASLSKRNQCQPMDLDRSNAEGDWYIPWYGGAGDGYIF